MGEKYTINFCQPNLQGDKEKGTSCFCTEYNTPDERCTFFIGKKICAFARKSDKTDNYVTYCVSGKAAKAPYGRMEIICNEPQEKTTTLDKPATEETETPYDVLRELNPENSLYG